MFTSMMWSVLSSRNLVIKVEYWKSEQRRIGKKEEEQVLKEENVTHIGFVKLMVCEIIGEESVTHITNVIGFVKLSEEENVTHIGFVEFQ